MVAKAKKTVVVDKGKAPAVKKTPKHEKAANVARPTGPWSPGVGKYLQHNGNIIVITSLEPLTAEVHSVSGQVQTNHPYPLESLDGVKPISLSEVFSRIG